MFERERTDPQQTDIEFDFFDDSPTVEAPGRERSTPRRGPRLPTRPPTGAQPSLFRLGALIAGAILLAVVLVIWVQSCRAGQKKAEYRDYMSAVAERADESAQLGKQLNQVLTQPGIKLPELRGELDGLSQHAAQILASARELDPPGPLREQQEKLVEALEFRVSGLDGLREAFAGVQSTRDAAKAGQDLAIPAQRLLASDVIWADLFVAGSQAVMSKEDVRGIPVPQSEFVQNADLAGPGAWTLIVERLTRPAGASGGLHGNQLVGVIVQPGAQQLSPTEDNTVKASDRLSFQVLVKNSGESQETQVEVSLTIQQNPLIRKKQLIDIINPDETKTVVFPYPGPPSFGTRATVKVNVEPVTGESNTGNNTAEYPVIFTLD